MSSCNFFSRSFLLPPLSPTQDLISAMLPRVLPAITEGLQDLDDDVRAVAAAALIPVVDGFVQLLPNKVRREHLTTVPLQVWSPYLPFSLSPTSPLT